MKKFIKIHPSDNAVVALQDINKGEHIIVDNLEIEVNQDVKRGHKIAIKCIEENHNVIKYGYPIGHAVENIKKGDFVHTHNLKTNLKGLENYIYNPKILDLNAVKKNEIFMGYKRENGDIGIRNELWIVPTVGCVNGIAEMIINKFKAEVNIQGIDSIEVFKHNYGCSQLGDDHENTKTILGDIVKHPNAGGVLVIGLGCENNTMVEFKKSLGVFNEKRVRFIVAQEVSDEIKDGVKLLKELFEQMIKDKREPIPISELKVGLKCGGSDGLSGITANPLLGLFSDYIISQGGTTVLTEVPEMFGAETILMERAKDKDIFEKTVKLINDFKQYFASSNQPVYENPSPGNKAGGITTLEEKSLGCTQKGGKAEVIDVLKYGETLNKRGLNLLSAPGNDLVASTALGASGCHMVLFTTGRGTPFGSFVPTMKISSNSQIYNLKPHWIDFNAGSLIDEKSIEELTREFIDYIIRVASGEYVNNERNNFREIAIFKTGVTL